MPTLSEVQVIKTSRTRRPWALRSIPAMPQVGAELMRLLVNEATPISQIADLAGRDPALTAAMLRVANSSLYAQRSEVRELNKAIVVLGTVHVKNLVWAIVVKKVLPFSAGGYLHLCWRHSLASALISEELAKDAGESPGAVFAAALLHDIGRLALLVCYPDECGELLEVCTEKPLDPMACEQQLFDIDHCRAGQWLAEQWNLPDDFRRAAGGHHDDSSEESEVVVTVQHACRLASAIGCAVIPRETASLADLLEAFPASDPEALRIAIEAVPERVDGFMKALGSSS